MSKSIFISTNSIKSAFKDAIRNKGYVLTFKSLIHFEAVDFELNSEDYDWIFFSSKRSFDYFIARPHINLSNYKIACIGSATATHILSKNVKADFIGKQSGNPAQVAEKFSEYCQNQRILFPQSDRSNKSIQKMLCNVLTTDLIVYKTLLNPIKLQELYDTLVFTSPSNAESYLSKNKITSQQQVIAWGKTTAQFLQKNNVTVYKQLQESSYEELLALL